MSAEETEQIPGEIENWGDFTTDEIAKIITDKKIKSSDINRLARIPVYEMPDALQSLVHMLERKEFEIDYETSPVEDIIQIISETATHSAGDVAKVWIETLPHFLRKALDWLNEEGGEFLNKLSDPAWKDMIKAKLISQEWYAQFQEGFAKRDLAGGILKIILMTSALMQFGSSFIVSFLKLNEQQNNIKFRPSIPDVGMIIANYYKNVNTRGDIRDLLKKHGIPDEYIKLIFDGLENILVVPEIQESYYRGLINKSGALEALSKIGYSPENAEKVFSLFAQIPNIQDIIRMAVREAFTPDIVQGFKLNAELPPDLVYWAEKQGYSKEWAEKYWIAHWVLPSPQLAFEMFQRDQLSEKELMQLLKAADFPEYLRDKIKNVAYTPLTRVDIRRMHATGVLDEKQVFDAYRHIGFSPENAKLMTQFTVRYNREEKVQLSKGEIIKAYKNDLFTDKQAIMYLESIGLPEEIAEFEIAVSDSEEQQKIRKELINNIEKQYKMGFLSQADVIKELNSLDVSDQRLRLYIDTWNIERVQKLKRPSEEQLNKWLVLNLITVDKWRQEMALLGWNKDYIDIMFKELTGE